jgi:glyoxylase-like metal-dependent hydrolase (beta-lactamase superfamily II)
LNQLFLKVPIRNIRGDRMKIGKYELFPIETGQFGLDGGAMFGIIPKQLWNRTNPADEQNRVTLHARNLLLVSDKRKILIDTGIGSNWDEKFSRIYRLDQHQYTLFGSLAALNLKPGDITDVLLTHLHFDHTGGSTVFVNGDWVPAFPNAKYYIQKEHFDWAVNPTEKDRASFVQNRFIPLYNAGILNFTEGFERFDDEIDLIPVNGHTMAQQLVKLHDSSETLLYSGDLFPFASHIPIPYVMGYDLEPLITISAKKKLLPDAVRENWKLFFEHDPEILMATVSEAQYGYAIDQVFDEWNK